MKILFFIIGIIIIYSIYQKGWFTFFAKIIFRGNDKKKIIALTFDDGPQSPYTENILEVLKKNKISATFFLLGENIKKYPESVKKIISGNHEIGNHSYSHKKLIFKTYDFIKNEIQKTDEILKTYKIETKVFRPPFGLMFILLPFLAQKFEKKIIFWNINSKDYLGLSAKKISEKILNKIRPGSIILMHDGNGLESGDRSNTVEVLKIIIPKLQEIGYNFSTISNLPLK
ncbi:MAG: polysaccharide deacetylase family protein [Candidatus Marinimicrobia bacterium]|nr:polysaccharide deacetylase family protein [Candidatus Neomarinimicrobiota bacterium]